MTRTLLACIFSIIAFPAITHSYSRDDCLSCHGRKGAVAFIDRDMYKGSVHGHFSCGKCHPDVEGYPHGRGYRVECGLCHFLGAKGAPTEEAKEYKKGVHGEAALSGKANAPDCGTCHGVHYVFPSSDKRSKTVRDKTVALCSGCHGREYDVYAAGVHGREFLEKNNKKAAVCIDCHMEHHLIMSVGEARWKLYLIKECGGCHIGELDTYRRSFHGKITDLGYVTAAKCSDCHGSHDILPPEDEHSTLSERRRVVTCGKCHPGATPGFTKFYAHADERSGEKYPALFYTYLLMTMALLGAFTFFFLHTFLWTYRSIKERRYGTKKKRRYDSGKMVKRFNGFHITLHSIVAVSFLGLVISGMPLRYSHTPWAGLLMGVLGGYERAGMIHGICAAATFGYLFAHIVYVVFFVAVVKRFAFDFFGPESMIPRLKDFRDIYNDFRWFLGKGPRPEMDTWTYWEKFDYWAVFVGVGLIGASGAILWFPEFFGRMFPGWIFNVATIMHSDVALLVAGFIFAVHFFHTHLRPEKFPMDTVIFTGRLPLEDLRDERPLQYQRLVEEGMSGIIVETRARPNRIGRNIGIFFGFSIVLIGLCLFVLIVLGRFFY